MGAVHPVDDGRRHGPVCIARDEQEGRAIWVCEVDPRRAEAIEDREGDLEEGAARVRHDLRVPDGSRLVERQRVDEGVAELREAPADNLAPPEWNQEDPADGQERSRVKGENALRWRRIDGDAGRPESTVEQ